MEALPLAPLMEAMRTIAIGGGSLADVGGELLQVAASVPVTFAIATVALRPKQTRSRRAKAPEVPVPA